MLMVSAGPGVEVVETRAPQVREATWTMRMWKVALLVPQVAVTV